MFHLKRLIFRYWHNFVGKVVVELFFYISSKQQQLASEGKLSHILAKLQAIP
jgi:hypothetical protein